MKQGKLFASALMTALITMPMAGHSETIYQTVNNGFGDTWNSDLWGAAAGAPTAGNDYVTTAGFMGSSDSRLGVSFTGRIRSDATADTTFAGDSITIVSDTELLLKQGGNQLTAGNIILDGGIIRLSAGDNCLATVGGTLSVASESYVGVSDFFMPVLTISSDLSGDSVLHLAAGIDPGIIRFTGDLSGFTGTLALGGGEKAATLDFDQDYDLSAADMVINTAQADILNLDQAITVGSFTFGAESALGAGTYSAADLNALYGTGSQFAGDGSLTVIPEPATISLIAVLGGGILFIRRRLKI